MTGPVQSSDSNGATVAAATQAPSAPAGSVRGPIARLAGRAGLNLLDQILSALTNVVLAFLVARAVNANDFGAFSVAFLVFTLLIGMERSLVGQPMSIRFSDVQGAERQRVVGAATATIVVLTGTAAAACAITGALIGSPLGPTLLALAAVIPGLILQDTYRMTFFAQRRPHLAVLNDLIWTVVQFTVMGVLYANGVASSWPYVLAWGGAGTVAALVGMIQLAAAPRFHDVLWWIRSQADITGYLFLEFLIGAASAQGSILVIGLVGSLDDVGSLRAAQTLLGPLGIAAAAVMTFGLPELSHRRTSPRTRTVVAVSVSAGIALGSLVYTLALVLIPRSLGTSLLGATWTGAHDVLLPMSLASVGAGACLGPAIVIYSMGQARKTFLLHAFEAPLIIVCVAVGYRIGHTPGAAWGLATNMAVMVPLWFWQMRKLLTAERASTI